VGPARAQDVRSARRDLAADDFRLRLSAALYLGRNQADGTRAELERTLDDAHPAVRTAAAAALASLGDAGAVPALTRRMPRESSASVKAQLKASIESLKASPGIEWRKTHYLVQLGSMKNGTSVRGDQLTDVLRAATKARASQLQGAVLVEGDASSPVFRQAAARHVPVLALDGAVTRLERAQQPGRLTYSAQVEFTVRRVPEQTLKGTLSGGATSIGYVTAAQNAVALTELQNQAVDGAVASALRDADASLTRAVK